MPGGRHNQISPIINEDPQAPVQIVPNLPMVSQFSPLTSEGLQTSMDQNKHSASLHKVSYANLLKSDCMERNQPLKPVEFRNGVPVIAFSQLDKARLHACTKHTLIGKFSHGKLSFHRIKALFNEMKFAGDFNLYLWDSKHLFIEFDRLEDYRIFWRGSSYMMDSYAMRVLKWTPNFTPEVENPTCPIWITLPRLPKIFYDEEAIRSIANSVGTPLKVDLPPVNRARYNECRVCVEIDVSQKLTKEVWITFGEVDKDGKELGFWQTIKYGELPG